MRARDTMHPLCCIAADCHASGDRSPEPDRDRSGPGSDPRVAGVLYKWTNYGKGWRSRWFSLRDGVVSYYKIRRRDGGGAVAEEGGDARLIGEVSVRFLTAEKKAVGFVNLKVSSFRESKSDDRRFYVFSPTKTLHLRTSSKKDRALWIEVLVSARSVYSLKSLSESISFIRSDISLSTDKLRDRMHNEGLGEALIKDCEQIMLSEFSEFHRRLKLRYEEHLSLLGPFQQHLEMLTLEELVRLMTCERRPQVQEVNVEDDTTTVHGGRLRFMKNEFSGSGHGKFSEYSTTESSDDIEKQEFDDLSDEDVPAFFDTKERFSDYNGNCSPLARFIESVHIECGNNTNSCDEEMTHVETEHHIPHNFPHIERRNTLPEPIEKEKSVSLWSMIKDNVGKDLTRVCLPVYFNEPLSSLQKCFEELEYSYLLDRAYEYGKVGNSLMRILNVAAFAVSGYASSDGRHRKPFNPLLGETYEADYPEKGIRFFSEKVRHCPMVIACHCEGNGWKFWGDSNLRSKFWGRSIQLDPVGILTLEFDDGEIFTWSKVTTNIYNLILGKLYCDHHGIMNIQGNCQYSCKLTFKEQSILDRNSRQVQGYVKDIVGTKVASLLGKWDDSMYYTIGSSISKASGFNQVEYPSLLWKRSNPPANPNRYNLSSFAITLNEMKPELKEKLPPTDSRLRPDQRHLENGEYEKANAEKQRLEQRQRVSRKLQENGWKPRWFQQDSKDGTFHYVGGYWEAREQRKWDGCLNIFGELSDVSASNSSMIQ